MKTAKKANKKSAKKSGKKSIRKTGKRTGLPELICPSCKHNHISGTHPCVKSGCGCTYFAKMAETLAAAKRNSTKKKAK